MKQFARFLLPLTAATLFAAPACAQDWSAVPAWPAAPMPLREAPPAPPAGAAPNQMIPARDAEGNYVTPNRKLSRDETSWHLRAALNVAALGCRDAAEAETVAAYNRLLRQQRATLATADAGVKSLYRARLGAGWESEHDRQMTRVYNFFAQPTAHDGFCLAAREVLAEIDAVTPDRFADFAAGALPRLEAPFTSFYREYDAYRTAYAAWRQGPRPAVTMAAIAPAPTGFGALVP
ncbi:hypothetical protein E5A74_12045 [Sphingomonas naasensis]|uniref:DUF4142 domain-containing protein n=2 Tax=Sphingomonas naasensis TaxID=1344951 RepID=A0A4S1WK39_9SPHN|nr:hypothetical protein [Sphingomonas naasensis]TGX41366.1 hypothetical protein E5A74_12045 [Sphingomonas naasensis]